MARPDGAFLPDHIVIWLLREEFKELPCPNGRAIRRKSASDLRHKPRVSTLHRIVPNAHRPESSTKKSSAGIWPWQAWIRQLGVRLNGIIFFVNHHFDSGSLSTPQNKKKDFHLCHPQNALELPDWPDHTEQRQQNVCGCSAGPPPAVFFQPVWGAPLIDGAPLLDGGFL